MSDNNVVQFPKKDGAPVDHAQDELRRARIALDTVNKQRKNAIEALDKRVKTLLDNNKLNAENMTPATVEVTRDLRQAINSTLLALEAHDKLVDMITHDLVGVVQNMEQQAVHAFQMTTHVQVVTELLMQKGLLSPADIEQKYKELMAPVQEKVDAIKNSVPSEESSED